MTRGTKTEVAGLALVAYVPFLLSSPGRVSADSKQALYLDPDGLLARAVDLWDPTVGAGGVPHQQLGYLVPTGPWFWAFEAVGLPDWVAQRLWWGTLALVAALGARWLFRMLGAGPAGALAGALVYAATPYQLAFTARMSVLLLPWAALPWLVGCTVRATRGEGWRAAALLGIVLLLVGGVNASSLVLVALGPLVWLVVDARRGGAGPRRVLVGAARAAVIAVGACTWWLVGIRLQAAYGLPVLQLTEDLRTVAEASTPGDVLRGLGNWFFYGRDRTGYSLDQAEAYVSDGFVVAVTYALPMAALAVAVGLRWAHRAYFALLVLVGTAVAVGSWPIDDPSPFGRVWRTFTSDTSLGLALRNSPRAVPLVVLGLAGLLAGAIGAVRAARWRRAGAVAVAGLAVAGLLPVLQEGGYLTEGLSRDEELPEHWRQAAATLDAGDRATRVLEVPGAPFAAYDWGTTVDPVTPSLVERPYLAREVLPDGGVQTVNLLAALDRRIQLGTLDPASVAPVARLLGVGTVSLRADLERSGRFDPADVDALWRALREAPGLEPPVRFGAGRGAVPPVALFDVEDPVPIVRTKPVGAPVVLAGDGDGVVDAAAAGVLAGDELVLYGTALGDATLDRALDAGAHLVVTDSHRRRIETWFYSIKRDRGPTERAGEAQPDPTGYDFRLDPFPGSSDASRTVVEHVGGEVEATAGLGPEEPGARAARAFDGDVGTAWLVRGDDPRGEAVTVTPAAPVEADTLRVVQVASASGRRIERLAVRVRGHAPVEVVLGPASLTAAGQEVPLPASPVDELRVEIVETSPPSPTYGDTAPVGLAELGLGDLVVEETVRPPVDLLRRVGKGLDRSRLTVVLTRLACSPGCAVDDELVLDRTVDLPEAVTVRLSGRADRALAPGRACRSDLLAVDGRPVAVRASGRDDPTGFTSCGPLELRRGRHRIEPVDRQRGAVIDQVVLDTDPDASEPSVPAPALRLVDDEPGRVRAVVEGASQPFWFVLGQSASDGWELAVDGGSGSERQLVDGYANGWVVTPDGDGPITITARWTPQRVVPLGFLVSAVTAVVCALVVVRTRRHLAPVVAAPPALALGWREAPAGAAATARAVGVVSVAGILLATPVVALAAGAATLVTAVVPRSRPALVALVPGALAASRLDARPSLPWLAVLLVVGAVLSQPARGPGAAP